MDLKTEIKCVLSTSNVGVLSSSNKLFLFIQKILTLFECDIQEEDVTQESYSIFIADEDYDSFDEET